MLRCTFHSNVTIKNGLFNIKKIESKSNRKYKREYTRKNVLFVECERNALVFKRLRRYRRQYKGGSGERYYSGAGEKEVPKSVGYWLFLCSGMVFGMVVLGGVTRLTESGLSMTDWHPVTGIMPPMTDEEWDIEFGKYKKSPEYLVLHSRMTVEEFKKIFYFEWAHRVMGRLVGVVFGVPFLYYLGRGFLNAGLKKKLSVLFLMGGMQGLIGWWMVKSGLEHGQEVPRVSPYRLTVHLSSAFVIYLGLLWTGFSVFAPLKTISAAPIPRGITAGATIVGLLTFITAISGAFVAGNDAGLVYNEFPKMGEGFVPEEYWDKDPWYLNFFEQPEAVQFNHRVMATTTVLTATAFWLYARRYPLPTRAKIALGHVFAMAWIQVGLGIATLLYLVPTPVAATHQAGSLTLLSFVTWLLFELKKIPKLK